MSNPERAQQIRNSKFLSFVLRHKPQAIGLKLDGEGWANIDLLLMGAYKEGREFTKEQLLEAVKTNDKRRFQISEDGTKIRAIQGHSDIDVVRTFPEVEPPSVLYHGTAIQYLKSISEKGILHKDRHYVHLSETQEVALSVGKRHGIPSVLVVNARLMWLAGHQFYRAENNVWLIKEVPPDFISDVIGDLTHLANPPRNPPQRGTLR